MKGVNHLKVFGIIVIIFMTLITVGYTMNQETKKQNRRATKSQRE